MAEKKKGWTRGNWGKNARNEEWDQPSRSVQRQHVQWILSGSSSGLRTHLCACLWAKNLRLINLYLMNSYGQLTRQVFICCFLILPVEKHTTHTPYLTNLTDNMRVTRMQLNCCLSIKFFNEVSTVWHWLMCYNHISLEGIGHDCWWRLTGVQFLHAKYHTPISLQMLPLNMLKLTIISIQILSQ